MQISNPLLGKYDLANRLETEAVASAQPLTSWMITGKSLNFWVPISSPSSPRDSNSITWLGLLFHQNTWLGLLFYQSYLPCSFCTFFMYIKKRKVLRQGAKDNRRAIHYYPLTSRSLKWGEMGRLRVTGKPFLPSNRLPCSEITHGTAQGHRACRGRVWAPWCRACVCSLFCILGLGACRGIFFIQGWGHPTCPFLRGPRPQQC